MLQLVVDVQVRQQDCRSGQPRGLLLELRRMALPLPKQPARHRGRIPTGKAGERGTKLVEAGIRREIEGAERARNHEPQRTAGPILGRRVEERQQILE